MRQAKLLEPELQSDGLDGAKPSRVVGQRNTGARGANCPLSVLVGCCRLFWETKESGFADFDLFVFVDLSTSTLLTFRGSPQNALSIVSASVDFVGGGRGARQFVDRCQLRSTIGGLADLCRLSGGSSPVAARDTIIV